MLKILIIDDEYYFRKFLQTCIDWKNIDCEIVGEASDGEEGFKLLNKLSPDVVLLDINMPCMDGIEFSRRVYEEQRPANLIILSGHSEFKYAQQAIQYGVKNYLLKPINEVELTTALQAIKNDIFEKQKMHQERLLNNLIYEIPIRPDDWRFSYPYYQILVIETETSYSENTGKYNRIKNSIHEILSDDYVHIFAADKNYRLVCLLGLSKLYKLQDNTLQARMEHIIEYAKEQLGVALIIGIGLEVDNLEHIKDSYNTAVFSLQNRHADFYAPIINYKNVIKHVNSRFVFNSELKKKLMIALRQNEFEKLENIIHELFSKIQSEKISYNLMKYHYIELINICLEYLEELSIPYSNVFSREELDYNNLFDKLSVSMAITYITEFYHKVLLYVEKNTGSFGSKQIVEINAYIDQNFCNSEFKIQDISDHFSMNYHYLCNRFKKQTGMTLNHYITSKRIAKAKQLMKDGYCNITLLAEMVGYNDLGYFGKCFKKETGISPTKYIETIHK